MSRGRSPKGWERHSARPIRIAARLGVSFSNGPLLGTEAAAWDAQRAPKITGLRDLRAELGLPSGAPRHAQEWARLFARRTGVALWAPENWSMVRDCASMYIAAPTLLNDPPGPGRPRDSAVAVAAATLRAKPWGPLPWSMVLAVLGSLGFMTPPVGPNELNASERAAEALRRLVEREQKR